MSSPELSRPNIVLRAAAWYVALGALIWATSRWLPQVSSVPPVADGGLSGAFGGAGGAAAGNSFTALSGIGRGAGPGGRTLAPYVALVMVSAALLALPLAWVYVLTRAKRGYQQSVVQTLVLLPMVVAGVVTLVKDSLALAFSLAGIVAAVRFRTALDDSKDAVYIFVATGVGLAAAMDLPTAVAISLLYNAAILALWFTDFGRAPAHLEGKVAERRMQRAMERMSRTGSFVARVDEQILAEMTAEQLDALNTKVARRARQNDPNGGGDTGDEERREHRMRMRTYDSASARRVVEPMLAALTRQWRHSEMTQEPDGTQLVEYMLVLRKSRTPEEVASQVKAAGAPHVIGVEVT